MGGYLEYPEYKDSGVEWIGKIPIHWKYASLRWISRRYAGGTPDKSKPEYWQDGNIPWLNSGAVNQGNITEPSNYITNEGFRNSSAKWIPLDGLLIALAGQGKTKGMVAQTKIRATCNQSVAAIVIDIHHSRYIYWWLISQYRNIRGLTSDEGRDGLNLEMVGGIPCPLPTIEEQQTIARFLDYKTAQIDALIAKKENLLAKLAEKRTALISQAVTKGLDPTVPMKDSGIEWLGDIPAHWKIMVLKRLAEVRGGVTKGRKLDNVETLELPYLRVANVQDGHIDTTDMSNIEITPNEVERYSLKAGDVLMNEGGDNDKLGRGAVWDARIDPCLHQNHVFAVRPDGKALSSWLALITSSSYAKFYFFSKAKQTTNLASISATNIKLLPVVLPPESERNQILEFLRTQDVEHEQAIERISEAVNKLKEYRTTLITNTVTGKIDVRDVKLPEVDWLEAS